MSEGALESLSYQATKPTLEISNGEIFKQTGNASFSYLFWDVYDSVLYTSKGAFSKTEPWQKQGPLILEIQYKRDIDANDLIDSTIEQWRHLKFNESQYSKYVPWFKETWPNLKKGDRLAILMHSDYSVFFYNNKWLATQKDTTFAHIFLSIWLAKETSEPKLRNQLLGYN